MFKSIITLLALAGLLGAVQASEKAPVCHTGADYEHHRLDSDQVDNLCQQFRDKVVLVVNTASRCGFTDQYDDLEKLYARYRERGLLVVGFPSNDFANQEPGDEKSIKAFCRLTYGVEFPMYGKTSVKAGKAHPFCRALGEASGETPRWNFHKYLLDRQGRLVGSWQSREEPLGKTITRAIEAAL
ncbi:MAG: glutathione peroxidase [Gammaproteobacteria bacterium SHHR-1]|uniref:glutathione peroxidase n=1 Tax=Magnetovirga frankeli TaxID=947516 RepID=UPI0012937A59|nr:glutathione peroxidase [gamma proteobacterium SS-5]